MNPSPPLITESGDRRRRGMTLVELLVVTGLLAMFLGLVVTGIRGSRQTQRRGAETLAAVLAAAQARALNLPEGAAAILASGSAATPASCTSLFDAVMLPLIEATVSGSLPSNATSAAVTVTPTNGDDVSRAYRILLYGGPTAPTVSPATSWLAFDGSSSTVLFRTATGQTVANTVWPKPPAGGTFDALLAQYPAKSSAVVELDDASAVDLRYSGVGEDSSSPYFQFAGDGAIAIAFNRMGRVGEVMQQVPDPGTAAPAGAPQPVVPSSPIYFLVASRSDVETGQNTLGTAESTWVAVSPQSGRIFIAENVPQADISSLSSALWAARDKARKGITVGK